jgi:hypothetical protein
MLAAAASAQRVGNKPTTADTIRRLEDAQIAALLRGDLVEMESRWAPGYAVNNPFNKIVDARHGPIRSGSLTYSSFKRDIGKVIVRGSTAIVMGTETVVPNGKSVDAGRTINRRFTDVWMKLKGKWLLVARHANEVCDTPRP